MSRAQITSCCEEQLWAQSPGSGVSEWNVVEEPGLQGLAGPREDSGLFSSETGRHGKVLSRGRTWCDG